MLHFCLSLDPITWTTVPNILTPSFCHNYCARIRLWSSWSLVIPAPVPRRLEHLLERITPPPHYYQTKRTTSTPARPSVISGNLCISAESIQYPFPKMPIDSLSFWIKHLSPVVSLPFSKDGFLLLGCAGTNSYCATFWKESSASYPHSLLLLPCHSLLKELHSAFCLLFTWNSSCSSHQSLHVAKFSVFLLPELCGNCHSYEQSSFPGFHTPFLLTTLIILYWFLFLFPVLTRQLTPRVSSLALFPFYPQLLPKFHFHALFNKSQIPVLSPDSFLNFWQVLPAVHGAALGGCFAGNSKLTLPSQTHLLTMLHFPHPFYQFRAPSLAQVCMDKILNSTVTLGLSECSYRLLIPSLKCCLACSIPCILCVRLRLAPLSSPYQKWCGCLLDNLSAFGLTPVPNPIPITILWHKFYGAISLLSNLQYFCIVYIIESECLTLYITVLYYFFK